MLPIDTSRVKGGSETGGGLVVSRMFSILFARLRYSFRLLHAVAAKKDRVLVSDEGGGAGVSVFKRGGHAVFLLRIREELEGLVWRCLAGDGFCVVRADFGQVACGLGQFEVAAFVV